MNQEEHLTTARELARRADQESSDGGNELIAAGLFWGAFAHCLITVALNEGLPHDSHGVFRTILQIWMTPTATPHGAHASEPPNGCTSTSTTATCQPGNSEPTDAPPQRVSRNC